MTGGPPRPEAAPGGRAAVPPAVVVALRHGIGAERLSGYDRAAGGDQLRALDLYNWNSAVSASVFEDLSVLEVLLLNACHRQLQAWNAAQGHRHPWYHHPVPARGTCKTSEPLAGELPRARRPRRKAASWPS